jgi:hypothetical protein
VVIFSADQGTKLRVNIHVGATGLKEGLAEMFEPAFGAFKDIKLTVRTIWRAKTDTSPSC